MLDKRPKTQTMTHLYWGINIDSLDEISLIFKCAATLNEHPSLCVVPLVKIETGEKNKQKNNNNRKSHSLPAWGEKWISISRHTHVDSPVSPLHIPNISCPPCCVLIWQLKKIQSAMSTGSGRGPVRKRLWFKRTHAECRQNIEIRVASN